LRIIATSDIHNLWDELIPHLVPADMLILAGDLTEDGTPEEFQLMLKNVGPMPYKHKIVIGGNHDKWLETTDIEEVKAVLMEAGITYLFNESHEIVGEDGHAIKLYGTPYSNKFSKIAFEKYEYELEAIFEDIPYDTDILITHCPAELILDKNSMGSFCGSPSLANIINERKPLVHIFGHIHESYGFAYSGEVLSMNVAACGYTKDYDPLINKPIVFDLFSDGSISVLNRFKR
jgi:Icc-related predicted phosphoesterase